MVRIKKVKYLSEYKLELLFNDGKTKIVDFENWINQGGFYILPLRDIKYFKKVMMDESNYTICWPNGADFCPDVLYEIGKEIHEQKKQPTPKIRRRKQISSEKTEFKILATAKAKKVSKKTKSK